MALVDTIEEAKVRSKYEAEIKSLNAQLKASEFHIRRLTSHIDVEKAIASSLLPSLYKTIDGLLEHEGKPLPKDVKIEARRWLPETYKHTLIKKKNKNDQEIRPATDQNKD